MKTLPAILLLCLFALKGYSQVTPQTGTAGIGITLKTVLSRPKIESVKPNSPADLAGLKAGDVITEVDGTDCFKKNVDEVVAMLEGTAGTTVSIHLMRKGDLMTFTVKRGLDGKTNPGNASSDFCTQLKKLLNEAAEDWPTAMGQYVTEGTSDPYYKSNITLPGFSYQEVDKFDGFSALYSSGTDTSAAIADFNTVLNMIDRCEKGVTYAKTYTFDSPDSKVFDYIPFEVNGGNPKLKDVGITVTYTYDAPSKKTFVTIAIQKEE